MTIVRLPVTLRTEEIVVGLNDARPGFMLAYPFVLYVLVHESLAGRLRIAPRRVLAGAEPLLPEMLADPWPMFVVAAADPHDPQQWALDQAIHDAGKPVSGLLRSLAGQSRRDGGLLAESGYAPAFSAAMDSVRELVRAGRDAEAFEVILGALPSWRPLSPLHLAPMGLTWDRDLGRIMTRERLERLLATARGSG